MVSAFHTSPARPAQPWRAFSFLIYGISGSPVLALHAFALTQTSASGAIASSLVRMAPCLGLTSAASTPR